MIEPYYQTDKTTLYLADCLDVLKEMADNSVDSIVTDPPYGLEFMGKEWDKLLVGDRHINYPSCRNAHGPNGYVAGLQAQLWHQQWAEQALRVLKPGGHMLAMGGTRTHHRLMCAIEDAGFEIRDTLCWLHGQGFPKSADVSKMLDKREHNQWLDVCKALDNLAEASILEVWKKYSNDAKSAGIQFLSTSERDGIRTEQESFVLTGVPIREGNDVSQSRTPNGSKPARSVEQLSQKSGTVIGLCMPENDTVLGNVQLWINPENLNVSAILVELNSIGVPHWHEESINTAHRNADGSDSGTLAISVGSQPSIRNIVPCNVRELLNERTAETTKAAEVLMTWLGRTKSSETQDTIVLCAALTENLKLTILSQSKTFLSLDTTQQMEVVSATNATITESTAASLISSMVNTLRTKALTRMAGAEREVVGRRNPHLDGGKRTNYTAGTGIDYGIYAKVIMQDGTVPITAPATPAAQQWDGWGTALKPAVEFIVLARKPLSEPTIAANVLRWGTGGLNIDATRIDTNGETTGGSGRRESWRRLEGRLDRQEWNGGNITPTTGRWPANLVLSHHPDCVQMGVKRVRGAIAIRAHGNLGRGILPVKIKDGSLNAGYADPDGYETVGKWECHPDCPVRLLDEQSGERCSKYAPSKAPWPGGMFALERTGEERQRSCDRFVGDTGGASRYFKVFPTNDTERPIRFRYQSKASRSEREVGCEGLIQKFYRLRSDLTEEQRAYVLAELSKAGGAS